jgi:hypothetical protein
MKQLKRNWKLLAGVFGLVSISGAVWWLNGSASVVVAQAGPPPEYAPVTDAQRDAMLAVLEDVSLDRDALVGLNVSAEQAVDLLAGTRQWFEANRSRLAALNATIGEKRVEVRRLEKAIRVGPREVGQDDDLASARQQLAAARRTYRQALGPLKSALAAEMSPTQRATWQVIERGWGRQMPIRMLALTSQQRHDYARALRRLRLQYAAADTAEARAAAQAAWEQALADILTDSDRQIIAAYEQYAPDAADAVANATNTVMPAENDSPV